MLDNCSPPLLKHFSVCKSAELSRTMAGEVDGSDISAHLWPTVHLCVLFYLSSQSVALCFLLYLIFKYSIFLSLHNSSPFSVLAHCSVQLISMTLSSSSSTLFTSVLFFPVSSQYLSVIIFSSLSPGSLGSEQKSRQGEKSIYDFYISEWVWEKI